MPRYAIVRPTSSSGFVLEKARLVIEDVPAGTAPSAILDWLDDYDVQLDAAVIEEDWTPSVITSAERVRVIPWPKPAVELEPELEPAPYGFSAENIAVLNLARDTLNTLKSELFINNVPRDSDRFDILSIGRLAECVDQAEDAIFHVLNIAQSHRIATITDEQVHNRKPEPVIEDIKIA